MNKWKRLWRAIARWWKNESTTPDRAYLEGARKSLIEYDDLYGQRIKVSNPLYRSQAAAIVEADKKMGPCPHRKDKPHVCGK